MVPGILRLCASDDVFDEPVAGVAVALSDRAGHARETRTGGDGCVEVPLEPGTWRASLTKAGWRGVTYEGVVVEPDRTRVLLAPLREGCEFT